MSKFRSRINFATIYDGDKGGYNVGLDAQIFLREESIPRTFQVPRVGTSGKSTSGATPSLDISAGTDNALKMSIDGSPAIDVVLVQAGQNSPFNIIAELELKANAAFAAAGRDERCWVGYTGGFYVVTSQKTGLASSVVITNAAANNVADDLKLGAANGGTEVAGTDDQDFLLYTTGGITYDQPIESNAHRSGRFHSGIVKQKKNIEFDFDTYINMSGTAGDSLDTAVKLLKKAMLGKMTVNAGASIVFEQDLPTTYFSLVRVSTIFGEYYAGGYVRGMGMAFPGDGPATVKYTGRAATRGISGLGKLSAAVTASTSVVLGAGEAKRYSQNGRVMLVDTDGRTILDGMDGSLKVVSVSVGTDTVVLNTATTAPMNGYLVPWNPGAVQSTARDNIYTDLVGSAKLVAGGSNVSLTEISLDLQNDHNDLDNHFGAEGNEGYIAGNRMTPTLGMTFNLSNENFGEVVQASEFGGFAPEIVLGNEASGRYLKITAPKWIPAVPPIELPENGPTSVTLEGNLLESAPGARDPLKLLYG